MANTFQVPTIIPSVNFVPVEKPRILIIGAVKWAQNEIQFMSSKLQFEASKMVSVEKIPHLFSFNLFFLSQVCDATSREEFIAFCGTKYQGILAIYRNTVAFDVRCLALSRHKIFD